LLFDGPHGVPKGGRAEKRRMHKHDEEHGGRGEGAEDNHETPEG
jgi:hypothetical protein